MFVSSYRQLYLWYNFSTNKTMKQWSLYHCYSLTHCTIPLQLWHTPWNSNIIGICIGNCPKFPIGIHWTSDKKTHSQWKLARIPMDDSSYGRNFDLDKKDEIHYHSWNEHFKMSKIAKFGCEITILEPKAVIFTARNTNIYKICELHRAIFSSFYNNSQPNFAILLILISFFLPRSKFCLYLESPIEIPIQV
jgi:hypothetical protein